MSPRPTTTMLAAALMLLAAGAAHAQKNSTKPAEVALSAFKAATSPKAFISANALETMGVTRGKNASILLSVNIELKDISVAEAFAEARTAAVAGAGKKCPGGLIFGTYFVGEKPAATPPAPGLVFSNVAGFLVFKDAKAYNCFVAAFSNEAAAIASNKYIKSINRVVSPTSKDP